MIIQINTKRENYEFLGVTKYTNLTFRRLFNKVSPNAINSAGLLFRLRNSLPPEVMNGTFSVGPFPAGHFLYKFSPLGLFPAGLFLARSFPR